MSDKPALRPELAVGEALRNIARAILVEARAGQNSGRSDADAVHDFRRKMKRWRALLRLLRPFLDSDGEQLRIAARDLARSLGGARDAQSALDALADLNGHGVTLSLASLARVRGRVEALRAAAESATLTADLRARIDVTLDDAIAAVDHWPVDSLTFAQVAARLAGGYRAARRAIPVHWHDADGETLHELRKRIVNHRYQAEIVMPLWPRFGRMWVGEAQRLRERLGKHQDLLALERLIGAHAPLARWRARLEPAIAARKAAHVAAAARLARRLLLEKPGTFRRRLEAMWATDA